jgi:hypothetical protein
MLTLQTLEKYVVSIHQLALAIDKRVIALESKERRKTVRAKRPMQQAKHKIKRSCSTCRYNYQCAVGMKCETSSFEKWRRA